MIINFFCCLLCMSNFQIDKLHPGFDSLATAAHRAQGNILLCLLDSDSGAATWKRCIDQVN